MSTRKLFTRRATRAVVVVLVMLSALLFVAQGVRVGVSTHYELPDAPLVMRAIDDRTTVADLEDLLAESPDLIGEQDPNGNMLIHHAVTDGRIEVVDTLLQHGADPNAPGMFGFTPLMIAISARRKDIVVVLLEHGADPAVSNRAALDLARSKAETEIAELLEEAMERRAGE